MSQATINNFDISGDTLNKYHGKDKNVVIPEGIAYINDCAFSECSSRTLSFTYGFGENRESYFRTMP